MVKISGLKMTLKVLLKNQNKSYEAIALQQNDIIKSPGIIEEQAFNNSLFAKKKLF